MTDKKEIDELRKELAEVKGRLPVETPNDPKAVAAWQDEQHQNRERQASAHLPFSRSDLAAMRAACPDHVAKAIAMRDARAPTGPSSAGTSGQTTRISTSPGIPGSNTGWAREIPIGPPPGLRYVDAQLDAQDRRDLDERIMQEALMKAGEPK